MKELKTITSKEFNRNYSLLVGIGQVKENKRAEALAEAINQGGVKVGRGDYNATQQYIINKFQESLTIWTKEAEEQGLAGVKDGQVYNALGLEVDVALNMKTRK